MGLRVDTPNTLHTRWPQIHAVITVARIICAPLLFLLYITGQLVWTITLFLLLVFTDYLDGYLARRYKQVSKTVFRAYLDSLADFILILTMFLGFTLTQVYPAWVLLLLSGLYLQFILTSGRQKPHYDPVGKYTGLFLFALIVVTLLFPHPLVYAVLTFSILGFAIVAIASRIISLAQSTD